MLAEQKDGAATFGRGTVVLSVYRWLIEVAFLFAAFTEFPTHKWSIGLGLLTFGGGVAVIGRAIAGGEIGQVLRDDGERRKTRHAIILASEQTATGHASINQGVFWSEVAKRVEREYEVANEYADKPTGRWVGVLLASISLIWQLAASLVGIGVVAALTNS